MEADPATPPPARAPAPPPPAADGRAIARAAALALVVAALDQLSKAVAVRALADGARAVLVPRLLDLSLALNDGAAWSMLAGRRPLLVGVSAAMLLLLAAERRALCATRLSRIASGLLAGGILGNLADRLRTGLVVDFIHVHRGDAWHFPTFNLADSAICIGVALLLLANLLAPCSRTRR